MLLDLLSYFDDTSEEEEEDDDDWNIKDLFFGSSSNDKKGKNGNILSNNFLKIGNILPKLCETNCFIAVRISHPEGI